MFRKVVRLQKECGFNGASDGGLKTTIQGLRVLFCTIVCACSACIFNLGIRDAVVFGEYVFSSNQSDSGVSCGIPFAFNSRESKVDEELGET